MPYLAHYFTAEPATVKLLSEITARLHLPFTYGQQQPLLNRNVVTICIYDHLSLDDTGLRGSTLTLRTSDFLTLFANGTSKPSHELQNCTVCVTRLSTNEKLMCERIIVLMGGSYSDSLEHATHLISPVVTRLSEKHRQAVDRKIPVLRID